MFITVLKSVHNWPLLNHSDACHYCHVPIWAVVHTSSLLTRCSSVILRAFCAGNVNRGWTMQTQCSSGSQNQVLTITIHSIAFSKVYFKIILPVTCAHRVAYTWVQVVPHSRTTVG
jgi:hypothetical protein